MAQAALSRLVPGVAFNPKPVSLILENMLRGRLPRHQLTIYSYLTKLACKLGWAFPSQRALAEKSGYKRRWVCQTLKELREQGYIRVLAPDPVDRLLKKHSAYLIVWNENLASWLRPAHGRKVVEIMNDEDVIQQCFRRGHRPCAEIGPGEKTAGSEPSTGAESDSLFCASPLRGECTSLARSVHKATGGKKGTLNDKYSKDPPKLPPRGESCSSNLSKPQEKAPYHPEAKPSEVRLRMLEVPKRGKLDEYVFLGRWMPWYEAMPILTPLADVVGQALPEKSKWQGVLDRMTRFIVYSNCPLDVIEKQIRELGLIPEHKRTPLAVWLLGALK